MLLKRKHADTHLAKSQDLVSLCKRVKLAIDSNQPQSSTRNEQSEGFSTIQSHVPDSGKDPVEHHFQAVWYVFSRPVIFLIFAGVAKHVSGIFTSLLRSDNSNSFSKK